MTILTTICYLEVDGKLLLLYRNKKENDINEGKWIGIGGKMENGETPQECILREFFEETNLHLDNLALKGYITFPNLHSGQDEGMFLFKATKYHGTIKENCDEGVLSWVDKKELNKLPMWEGDKYLFEWLESDFFVEGKLVYEKDQLISKSEICYES